MSFDNDSRKIFYENWIRESPQRTTPRNDLNGIIQNILEFNEFYEEIPIQNNLFILKTSEKLFIYGKKDNEIVIAVEFEENNQNLTVIANAKSDTIKNSPPYMSELYEIALEYSNSKSILFKSDKTITDDGIKVWLKLLAKGKKITVYNTENPGQSFKVIDNEEELKKYWDYEADYRKYRFILSENKKHWLDSVYSSFSTRRIRELANITFDEDYRKTYEQHN